MSASDTFENDILLLLLNNTNIAGLGDATGVRGSTTAGSVYVALHTADPGEAGTQATNEASYTGYSRIAVARSASGWTVSGSGYSNTAAVTWPKCTAGTAQSVTHFSIGTASSGTGKILFSGALDTALSVSTGIAPSADVGALSGTVD